MTAGLAQVARCFGSPITFHDEDGRRSVRQIQYRWINHTVIATTITTSATNTAIEVVVQGSATRIATK